MSLLGALGSGADFRLSAYVILSLLTGVRTEEARALHWAEVALEAGTVAVYRSVRAKNGGSGAFAAQRVLKRIELSGTAFSYMRVVWSRA